MAVYGYVRVSTKEQHLDRQLNALRELVAEENIYADKQSGKDFEREAYQELLKKLQPGDLMYIKSIDRLGRNYREILEQWRYLTREKQIDICVTDLSLLDTRKGKDLLGTLISDMVLQLLSFVAENERNMTLQRQAEGIAAAKARGVRFGKRPLPYPENFQEVYRQVKAGKLSICQAARACSLPRSTFRGKLKAYEDELKREKEKEQSCF